MRWWLHYWYGDPCPHGKYGRRFGSLSSEWNRQRWLLSCHLCRIESDERSGNNILDLPKPACHSCSGVTGWFLVGLLVLMFAGHVLDWRGDQESRRFGMAPVFSLLDINPELLNRFIPERVELNVNPRKLIKEGFVSYESTYLNSPGQQSGNLEIAKKLPQRFGGFLNGLARCHRPFVGRATYGMSPALLSSNPRSEVKVFGDSAADITERQVDIRPFHFVHVQRSVRVIPNTSEHRNVDSDKRTLRYVKSATGYFGGVTGGLSSIPGFLQGVSHVLGLSVHRIPLLLHRAPLKKADNDEQSSEGSDYSVGNVEVRLRYVDIDNNWLHGRIWRCFIALFLYGISFPCGELLIRRGWRRTGLIVPAIASGIACCSFLVLCASAWQWSWGWWL